VTAPKAWARRLKVGEGLKGFVENAVFGDECRNYIAKAIGNVIVVDSALARYRELVGAVPVASGVRLLYRFILLYGHSLISFPLIAPWICIRLRGVQSHPWDPTPWLLPLGRVLYGSSPLTGNLIKMCNNVKPYKPL